MSGEALLTQFLRVRIASEMLSEGRSRSGVQELRAALAAGETVEVAGYALNGQIAASMDALRLVGLAPLGTPVRWFELVPESGRDLPPAAQRVAQSWMRASVRLEVQCVPGLSFWNSVEISECRGLIDATSDAFAA